MLAIPKWITLRCRARVCLFVLAVTCSLILYSFTRGRRSTSHRSVIKPSAWPSDHGALWGRNNFERHGDTMRAQDGSGRRQSEGEWYSALHPHEMYVYSAFLDDRDVRLGVRPNVRVITVAQVFRGVLCKLWLAGDVAPLVVPAYITYIGMGVVVHGEFLRECIFSCPVPRQSRPQLVTLLYHQDHRPLFKVPVEIPKHALPRTPFTVCVSVSFGDIDRVRLVEWLEMQSILGVGKVVIYNHSVSNKVDDILSYYSSTGLLDVRHSHQFLPDADLAATLLHMAPVINDCMYRYMRLTDHLIVTDLDELIVPRLASTLSEMMANIQTQHRIRNNNNDNNNHNNNNNYTNNNNEYTNNNNNNIIHNNIHNNNIHNNNNNNNDNIHHHHHHNNNNNNINNNNNNNNKINYNNNNNTSAHSVGSYVFRNVYFFREFGADPSLPAFSTFLRYRKRLPPDPSDVAVKSIVLPLACVDMHNHVCLEYTARYRSHQPDMDVPVSHGLLHHYKACHFDRLDGYPVHCADVLGQVVEDDTLLRHESKLISAVYRAMKDMHDV